MIIAIDFDGTVVTHRFPDIGKTIGNVEYVLKELVKNGHKLILYTMRSHKPVDGRDTLQEAIDWFKERDIELWGINEDPTQLLWTDSPKAHADMYIDDSALGCPKLFGEGGEQVDWFAIENVFKKWGIIKTEAE